MSETAVYLAHIDAPETAQWDRYLNWLNPEERQRYERMAHADQRRRYLLARALLRQQVGLCLAVEPARVELRQTPEGKPMLADRSANLQFNLSHSGHWAALALSQAGPVGVDLEQPRRARPWRAIADQYFHAEEARALAALDEAAGEAAFYRLWTLKEAYLKALGRGLAGGLARLYFPAAGEDHRAPEGPERWQLQHWANPTGDRPPFYLSLALDSVASPPVRLYQGLPGEDWVKTQSS